MTPKYFISIALIVIACNGKSADSIAIDQCKNDIVKSSDFQLIKADHQKGLLILFPCFPCDSENTLDEFNIHDLCVKSGFSVLALNFNQRLYLKINEKRELAEEITSIILENDLPIKNIFIGGFSSGGNVSLLLADHLVKTKNQIQPKGVFIVDSPVDLLALYRTSEKNVENNYSPASIEESIWIKQFFDKEFGQPSNGISNYEEFSPYTFKTQNISNLLGLKHLKIKGSVLKRDVSKMLFRKNTKFNKNNGYKDFSQSIIKQNVKVHNQIADYNSNESSLSSKIDAPHKE